MSTQTLGAVLVLVLVFAAFGMAHAEIAPVNESAEGLRPLTPDPTLPSFRPVTEPPQPGHVPKRWPEIYNHPLFHFSIDSRPIRVTLRHFNDPDSAHRQRLRIPAAYIIFVTRYTPQDFPRLPGRLETNHISLALSYPDGKALSVHLYEMASERHPGSDRRVGFYTAAKSLRDLEYRVDLSRNGSRNMVRRVEFDHAFAA